MTSSSFDVLRAICAGHSSVSRVAESLHKVTSSSFVVLRGAIRYGCRVLSVLLHKGTSSLFVVLRAISAGHSPVSRVAVAARGG